ncbi:MAG: hypothetical protein IPL95_18675 [Saprospiraceae bacterium]|nr:hypothetical protein [Saprospiraceae bacterium]
MTMTGGLVPLEIIVSGLTMVPNVSGSTVTINGFGSLTISGSFVREDNVSIPNVNTTLTNAGPASTINSGATNTYLFNVSTGSNPNVKPVKNGTTFAEVSAGVNSVDLIAIQKHILGSPLLTSPHQ